MVKKPHFTKRYARYRIRSPRRFIKSSFRTHDIGRPRHSKRIAGKLRSSGKWATQAMLITKGDYRKGYRVKMVSGRPKIVFVRASRRARAYWRRKRR